MGRAAQLVSIVARASHQSTGWRSRGPSLPGKRLLKNELLGIRKDLLPVTSCRPLWEHSGEHAHTVATFRVWQGKLPGANIAARDKRPWLPSDLEHGTGASQACQWPGSGRGCLVVRQVASE